MERRATVNAALKLKKVCQIRFSYLKNARKVLSHTKENYFCIVFALFRRVSNKGSVQLNLHSHQVPKSEEEEEL